jgi:uncharacterized RDD family membrane protein YckC
MRKFSARETEWLKELDGIELAAFWPRALAFAIDWFLVVLTISLVASLSFLIWIGARRLEGKPAFDLMQVANSGSSGKEEKYVFALGPGKQPGEKGHTTVLGEIAEGLNDVLVPVLYFGILTWKGKGRTPGKRLLKIRVVSIMHRHLSFWHSVERALGYGAAALEGGFGFVQFFIHPYRRCAQDRLAETIVVTEPSYQALQHRLSHPLVPDTK